MVYHSNKKIDRSYYKYLEGKDVQRYNIDWSGEYLKYGINLASPRKNFALFSDNRILVKQIPSLPPYCINAAFYEETLLNDRNSMNIINIKINPLLLLAVINSKLLSYWFFYKFAKFQRKTFPQFKVNELAMFPISKLTNKNNLDIIKLVEKILNSKDKNEINDLGKEIDQNIYNII